MTTTSAAGDGPWLITVKVHVSSEPGRSVSSGPTFGRGVGALVEAADGLVLEEPLGEVLAVGPGVLVEGEELGEVEGGRPPRRGISASLLGFGSSASIVKWLPAALAPGYNGAAMRRQRPGRARTETGFSLLEVLVALTLMALAMLFTISLLWQQPRTERRVDAHTEAIRMLETVLEEIRAHPYLPPDGELDLRGLPQPTRPKAQELGVEITTDALPERSLYELTLTARYRVGPQLFEQSLETMIWVP